MGLGDLHPAHHVLFGIGVGATLAFAALSAFAARSLILQLPSDILDAPRAPLSRTRAVLRMLAGAALVSVGIALLVLPGPGVMLIVIGALMLAPSWRTRIVRRVVTRPRVLHRLNEFRRRHGRPELDLSRASGDP